VPVIRGTVFRGNVVDRIILSTVKHRNNADCQDERTEQKTALVKRSPASVRQSPILSGFRSIVERRRRRESGGAKLAGTIAVTLGGIMPTAGGTDFCLENGDRKIDAGKNSAPRRRRP
jgi:hypothetical protein